MPKLPVKLYRGLGFDTGEAAAIIKKFKIEPEEGSKGVYKTAKIQSWTDDFNEAVNFAGRFVMGAMRDEHSLGIVVSAVFEPKDIVIPVKNLPADVKQKCVSFDQNEYLIDGGTYQIKVEKLIGDWKTASGVDFKKILRDVGKRLALKHNADLKPTWNRDPGFSLSIKDRSRVGGSLEVATVVPKIEVTLQNDYSVWIEAMAFFKDRKIDTIKKKFSDPSEIEAYLTGHELEKDIDSILSSPGKEYKR